jgi:hypothetical protein
MSASTNRRPMPALAFLLALTVLTAIVWWRVLHRAGQDASAGSQPSLTQTSHCVPGGKPIALPAPKSVTIYVWNGNGTQGLAAKVDSQLKSRGFASAGFNTNPSTITGVGEIHYAASAKAGATLLSYYVPGVKMVPVSRPDRRVDVVLGSGFKALASPATVNKSVASAKKPC